MIDATPLTPKQNLLNSIINLCVMTAEVDDLSPMDLLEILNAAPKAMVIRLEQDFAEEEAIAMEIPPRTDKQWSDEDMALPA